MRYKKCPVGLNPETFYLIRRRRLQLIVHSIIYYEFDSNIILDKTFDEWGRELIFLQKYNPEESEACELYDIFKDWSGDTGFHLTKCTWAIPIAERVMKAHIGRY